MSLSAQGLPEYLPRALPFPCSILLLLLAQVALLSGYLKFAFDSPATKQLNYEWALHLKACIALLFPQIPLASIQGLDAQKQKGGWPIRPPLNDPRSLPIHLRLAAFVRKEERQSELGGKEKETCNAFCMKLTRLNKIFHSQNEWCIISNSLCSEILLKAIL